MKKHKVSNSRFFYDTDKENRQAKSQISLKIIKNAEKYIEKNRENLINKALTSGLSLEEAEDSIAKLKAKLINKSLKDFMKKTDEINRHYEQVLKPQ